MRTKTFPPIMALVVVSTLAVGGFAAAATRAKTTVTIESPGSGEYRGYVSSPKPRLCAKGRKVLLYKQKGTVQDRSVDTRVASDRASLNGDRYQWNTGQLGMYGRFYAFAVRTPDCQPAFSDTIRTKAP